MNDLKMSQISLKKNIWRIKEWFMIFLWILFIDIHTIFNLINYFIFIHQWMSSNTFTWNLLFHRWILYIFLFHIIFIYIYLFIKWFHFIYSIHCLLILYLLLMNSHSMMNSDSVKFSLDSYDDFNIHSHHWLEIF